MDLTNVRFGRGNHPAKPQPHGVRDMCIMEAVAFVAGEPWSDGPQCACPVISRFLRNWQDVLLNEDRDRLFPAPLWVPRLIGSRASQEIEQKRLFLILDWFIRVAVPAWIEPASPEEAKKLSDLPQIGDEQTKRQAYRMILQITPAVTANLQNGAPAALKFLLAPIPGSKEECYGASGAGAACMLAATTLMLHPSEDAHLFGGFPGLHLIRLGILGLPQARAVQVTQALQQSALDLLDRMLTVG